MPKEYVLHDIPLEDQGQPPRSINLKYRLGREMDELLGICKGIISDNLVVEKEAQYLNKWLHANAEIATVWPAKDLTTRLARILWDGKVTEEERDELLQFLQEMTGEQSSRLNLLNRIGVKEVSPVTSLPLDAPPPEIIFEEKEFCFTGKFVGGTRAWCENEISKRGGRVTRAESCEYLVTGLFGSRDWAHSTHGRKIEAAMNRKANCGLPWIVAEEHWSKYLL